MNLGLTLFAAFSGTVFFAVYLLPVRLWLWLGLALLTPAATCFWRKRRLSALICLGAAAGLLWCSAYHAAFFAPARALDGRRTQVRFLLSQSAVATDYGASVNGYVLQPDKPPVQTTLYGDEALLTLVPGDQLEAICDCTATAFQEGDRFTARSAQGVFLRAKAKSAVTVLPGDSPIPWWCFPIWWGERLAQGIERAFPQDVSGFLTALVTGNRHGIDSAMKTDLARSGITHLVAVSGMHVNFLVGFLTLLTGYEPKRRLLLCAPVLVFFTLAVGAAPSVVRACLMQLAILISAALGRETHPWTSLFGALSFLLLLDPFSAAGVSLQLSFAAVAGIFLVTPRMYDLLKPLRFQGEAWWVWPANTVLLFFQRILAVSVGAMAFTVPLSAIYFKSWSIAAPLTNLLVLPVASLLFAASLVIGLLSLVIPTLAGGAAWVVAWLGRYVLWVARGIAAFPYSAVPLEDIYYPAALLGIYALGLIAFLWRGEKRRVWFFALCGVALVAGSIFLSGLVFRTADLTAAVLDVGQGQSVILSSQGHTAVIDCGGSGFSDPGDVCADYLTSRGEDRIDKLILTHFHADHTNGLEALFRRMEISEVILPRVTGEETGELDVLRLAVEENAKVTWLESDTKLALGQTELKLFAPLGTGGGNEEGLSVLTNAGDFHLLVTGDMNTVVEERLVRHGRLPRCQVLVAGHHGSRYASGDFLLDALHPQTAVISVGANNTYGHPAPDTLERFAQRGVEVYRTDTMGTVTLRVH